MDRPVDQVCGPGRLCLHSHRRDTSAEPPSGVQPLEPTLVLRTRHGKITAASGSNARVPCAERDVLPIRTTQNQRVSDRAENCGKKVAVGVARRGDMWGPMEDDAQGATRADSPDPAGQYFAPVDEMKL